MKINNLGDSENLNTNYFAEIVDKLKHLIEGVNVSIYYLVILDMCVICLCVYFYIDYYDFPEVIILDYFISVLDMYAGHFWKNWFEASSFRCLWKD